MTEQGTPPPEGATPSEPQAPAGVTPTEPTPDVSNGQRDATHETEADTDDGRDAQQPPAEVLKALRAERRRARELEKELNTHRAADKAREDAGKTELQRVSEERDVAVARANSLERAKQATDVAAEFGVPDWADELAQDEDTRTMRTHAQRIRDRLGRTSPGMDGGVRGVGVPPAAQSMDDMIRRGFGR